MTPRAESRPPTQDPPTPLALHKENYRSNQQLIDQSSQSQVISSIENQSLQGETVDYVPEALDSQKSVIKVPNTLFRHSKTMSWSRIDTQPIPNNVSEANINLGLKRRQTFMAPLTQRMSDKNQITRKYATPWVYVPPPKPNKPHPITIFNNVKPHEKQRRTRRDRQKRSAFKQANDILSSPRSNISSPCADFYRHCSIESKEVPISFQSYSKNYAVSKFISDDNSYPHPQDQDNLDGISAEIDA